MFKRKTKKIYLSRRKSLGDIIMCIPIIEHYLMEGFQVTLFIGHSFISLFDNHPSENLKVYTEKNWARKAIAKTIYKNRFHHLRFENNPQINVQEALSKICKLKNYSKNSAVLYLSDSEKINRNKQPYVLLHMESLKDKNYRKTYGINWETIVRKIEEQGFKVYEIAISKTSKKFGTHKQTKNLRELMTLIYHCEFFIGIDSGPSHIAAAFDKKCFLLFGAVLPELRHHDFKRIETFYGECEYRGCYHYMPIEKDNLGWSCAVVGDDGVPPCCIHNQVNLERQIQRYISMQ